MSGLSGSSLRVLGLEAGSTVPVGPTRVGCFSSRCLAIVAGRALARAYSSGSGFWVRSIPRRQDGSLEGFSLSPTSDSTGRGLPVAVINGGSKAPTKDAIPSRRACQEGNETVEATGVVVQR